MDEYLEYLLPTYRRKNQSLPNKQQITGFILLHFHLQGRI